VKINNDRKLIKSGGLLIKLFDKFVNINKMENNNAEKKVRYFVIDDTICEVTGKLIEQVSYVYDHCWERQRNE